MKRRLYLILLLVAVTFSAMAQNVGEAFYIYRNDGEFNAFFRDEVQSIDYSYEDADGNTYDEIVTQIVTTADSVYRIPIAAIDSLSFLQPVPVYAENTIELSGQLVDYIISVEGLTIHFRSDTPENLLPKVGDKLAQLGFTNVFPDGFVGQVSSVTNQGDVIIVTCESLTIDDVVTSYSAVYRLDVLDEESYRRKSRKAPSPHVLFDKALPSATIPIHINLEALGGVWKNETLHEETGLGGSGDFKIDITPTFDIKVSYYRNDLLGIFPSYNVHVVTDVSMSEELQLMGLINGERKWPFTLPPVLENLKDYPVAPGVTVYFDAGLKVSGNGSLGAGAVFEQQVQHVTDIKFYPLFYPLTPPISTVKHRLDLKGHDEEWLYFLGDFEAKIGPFIEVGVGFINHKVSKVGGEFDFGAKFGGSVKFDPLAWGSAETKTDFYDNCKDESKMTFDVSLGGSLIAAALDERLKFSRGGDIDLERFHNEASLLPSFNDVTLQQNTSKLKFSANIGSKCIFPLQVGGALFNSENSRLQTVPYQTKYWTPNSFTSYSVDFTDVPMPGEFTAYPTVRLFGKDILASPSAELELQFPVELTNFKVTNSQYQPDGFSHNGQQYDYRFDVSITATLDDEAENISDWGYAYLDPNGNEALISLKSFGTSYTDTRYAYFRNQAHSTCTLYGYVKYAGSNEVVYGEPHDYPLDYQSETTCPVAITNFEQTNSNCYILQTMTHIYEYDCILTVELKDSEDVEDWGIIYQNPLGTSPTKVSLKAFNSPYIDTYIFSSSNPNSTISIYEYVSIGNKYYYGEPKDYQVSYEFESFCPDENHPHVIDLGLPSGTKWSCCNLGSNKPEEIGNLYSWGETSDKPTYNKEDYLYLYTDIGSDIAGTGYDAAHVCWGGSWIMPSYSQCRELSENCSYEWIRFNGMDGGKFTGSNGKSIFIPCNNYYYEKFRFIGRSGFFGSSAVLYSNDDFASGFGFNKTGKYWDSYRERYHGESIRPVCK